VIAIMSDANVSSYLFLTKDELFELVSSSQKKTQIRWLSKNNVPYFLDRFGCPVVSRSYVLERLAREPSVSVALSPVVRSKSRPNFHLIGV
jgi:hypothetical protein